nr:probable E3 ubiquitin-protein ligase RNF217 [Ipomoea trifida]
MEEKIWSFFEEESDEEISDAHCAEELQLQEALQASFASLQMISSNQEEEEEAESSGFFCGICMERKESSEIFKNNNTTCSHSFCSLCIGEYVQSRIDLNLPPGTCPDPDRNCPATIDLSSCKSILPEAAIAKWERWLTQSSVDASQIIYCPYGDCSEMFVYEDEEITEAECSFCRRLFCAQCRVPWHADQDCEEFRESEGDVEVEEMARNFKWMKCPHCNRVVDKIDGCIHITCWCGLEFCYVCGSIWSEDHWDCQTENDIDD